eukprot:518905_1
MSYWKFVTFGYIRRIQKCIGNDCMIPDDIMLLCSKYSHAYISQPSHYVCEEDKHDKEAEALRKFIEEVVIQCYYLLIFFAIGILGMCITGFVSNDLKNVMFWTIFSVSLTASAFGLLGTYKYSIICNKIDEWKRENWQYEHKINQIQRKRKTLETELHETEEALMDEFIDDVRELEEHTKQIEIVLEELRNISGNNKDILVLLDQVTEIHNSMRKLVLETDRTHLVLAFCQSMVSDADLDRQEYQRFLNRLSKQ